MRFRRRKTYLEGIMEGRRRQQQDDADMIRLYAEHERLRLTKRADRTSEIGDALVGNWIGGINDAALVVERKHPTFPPKGDPEWAVCTCGKPYPADQDPHPWKPRHARQ